MDGGGAGEAGSDDLHLDLDDSTSPPVVRASGVLDVATAGRLRAQLTRLVFDGAETVVLDLADVTFVDSTALGVIARAAQRSRLIVRGASAQVRQLFTVTMLDSIVELESDP